MKQKRMRRNKAFKFTATMLLSLIGLFAIGAMFGFFGGAVAALTVSAIMLPATIKDNDKLSDAEKKMFEALLEEAEQYAAKAAGGKASQEYIDTKSAELTDRIKAFEDKFTLAGKSLPEYTTELQKQVDAIEAAQKAFKFAPNEETKSFAESLKMQIKKEIAEIEKLAVKNAPSKTIKVKSFLETDNTSVTTGSLIPTPQFEPGVSKAPDRMPFMLDIISRGNSTSDTIYWTQRKTRTDNTEWVAEGVAPANQTVLGYETKSASMQSISEFIKVSNKSVRDIEWLISEVQTELVTLLMLKLDTDLFSGTVATNGFDGVYTVAKDFDANGKKLASGVTPNNYDVLKFAARQVKRAKFRSDYVSLNGDDILEMELERTNKEGEYIWPPYMNVEPQIAGIRIVENDGVPAGSFLIGQFSKAKFWSRLGMELKIWEQNESDAVAQLKTITLYMEGTLVVKDADKFAFVKGTFDAAKTAIYNPGA